MASRVPTINQREGGSCCSVLTQECNRVNPLPPPHTRSPTKALNQNPQPCQTRCRRSSRTWHVDTTMAPPTRTQV